MSTFTTDSLGTLPSTVEAGHRVSDTVVAYIIRPGVGVSMRLMSSYGARAAARNFRIAINDLTPAFLTAVEVKPSWGSKTTNLTLRAMRTRRHPRLLC
jgi:hypothetical protein